MATVLKNLLRRGYAAGTIGDPPLNVDLSRRGEIGDCTAPLNDSQAADAVKLPGYGIDVALAVAEDAPGAIGPTTQPAASLPAKAKPEIKIDPNTPPSPQEA